jgi:hypothetical protein
MLKIVNKIRGPLQIMVKSKRKVDSFTTLTIPGIGKGKNIVLLEDERITENIERLRRDKLLEYSYIEDVTEEDKGEQ